MTGIGEAGLIVSLIPLLVSTAEHWGDIIRPFRRLFNPSAEVKRFQQKVMIQRAIYKIECHLLLWSVTDRERATAILENKADVGQEAQSIGSELQQRFGRSAEAYVAVVEQIRMILDQIAGESRGLEQLLVNDRHNNEAQFTGDAFKKRTRLGKRLKFSFAESKFDGMVATLESSNRDLITLSSQVIRIRQRETHEVHTSQVTWDDSEHRRIADASKSLHLALRKACTKHTKHTAYLSLDPNQSRKADVQFNLSYAHLALSRATPTEDLAWFDVDFVKLEETTRATQSSTPASNVHPVDMKRTSKRQRSPPALQTPKKARVDGSSMIDLPTPRSSGSSASRASSHSSVAPNDRTPKLHQRGNLCDQVRRAREQTPVNLSSPMGLLDQCEKWKQVVYPPSQKPDRQGKTSLAELIPLLSQQSRQFRLPKHERLRFARLLATAMLNFNDTPWLRETWCSEDIVLFGLGLTRQVPNQRGKERAPERRQARGEARAMEASPIPYLNSQIASLDDEPHLPASSQSRSLAPCQVLFRLGVIMLELAHEAPLHTLQQPCDLEGGTEQRYTEFFAARRLGQLVDSDMGCLYGKIVRQCLQCDFGRGNDFGDSKLQAVFHENVVCELQKLEEDFPKLQLGMQVMRPSDVGVHAS